MDVNRAPLARAPLAHLARLDDATRLHRLQIASPAPLLVERWAGEDLLSSGFEWRIDVLSTDAGLRSEWAGRRRAAPGAHPRDRVWRCH